MRGSKPKFDYKGEEFLSTVESFAKKGFTDKEIALTIGLSPQKFCEKKSEHIELREVLSRARAEINAVVRAKFLAMAIGGIKTKNITKRKIKDINGDYTNEEEILTVESELAPNLNAQSTWLYHHDPEWRKRALKKDEEASDVPQNIESGVDVDNWIKGLIK